MCGRSRTGVHSRVRRSHAAAECGGDAGSAGEAITKAGPPISIPSGGKAATVQTVQMTQRTFGTINPTEIVKAFAAGEDLWVQFGTRTVTILADGVRTLRAVWKARGKAGGGDTKISAGSLKEADHKVLIGLYMKKTWAPSKTPKTTGTVLK
jgi:hypothetical protein